ncbi:transcription factor bHLH94 [Aegilops tauschii subsp. strangulata]|uniref:BHLH domain-containing protein n=1 Tax=Aegilops tauschii subsp. strangulata TaxID=200361 RepID=A0A453L0J0_AEGTS|nr:transcription factor bHLH94 [Aegilops tauschii subsp. strangulata]
MALEAAVLSRAAAGLFGRCAMAGAGGAWNGLFGGSEGLAGLDGGDWDAAVAAACSSMLLPPAAFQDLDISATAPQEESGGRGEMSAAGVGQHDAAPVTAAATGRRKRRRTRTAKNSEEVESQRMTHIAVERNRRKQMNEYLAALRSLMPPSYALRGDQASIVGGAINFVKELEQLLQTLETQRQTRERAAVDGGEAQPPLFANFFTFPQYSMSVTSAPAPPPANNDEGADGCAEAEASGSKPSAVADVEVTMVESHANLRMLSRRRPRQLLRLLVGLQGHRLTVLHLNMSSASHMVLYSLSLKVEDDCQLTSVDEIATAAHQIIEKIQEEQDFTSA